MRRSLVLILLCSIAPCSIALGWQDLWYNADQQGAHALTRKQPAQAATLFKNTQWRAVANYRAGNYQAALNGFAEEHTAIANYNRGNSLAHLGQYQQAIEAYNQALAEQPNFSDAKFNRDLLKKLLPQQKQLANNQKNTPQNPQSQQQPQAHSTPPPPSSANSQNNSQPQTSNSPSTATKNTSQQNSAPDKTEHGPKKTAQTPSQNTAQQQPAKPDKPSSSDASTQQRNAKAGQATNEAQTTQQENLQQWLQQIPDDPGGLLKQKFLRDHLRQATQEE